MKLKVKSLCQQILKHKFELVDLHGTLCPGKNIVAFCVQVQS